MKNNFDPTIISNDKFRGCIFGGAIGDALGYPVEFLTYDMIQSLYGDNGITEYKLNRISQKALISDDTQMTLFTANGILNAFTSASTTVSYKKHLYSAYLDWLKTQDCEIESKKVSWLLNIEELHDTRAPGNTCISALRSNKCGSVSNHINNSKGCGGIMRVAPIGLLFGSPENRAISFDLACEAAAITHTHPLGYISSGSFSYIISSILGYNQVTRPIFSEIIKNCIEIINRKFSNEASVNELIALLNKAIYLAESSSADDLENIKQLGEGWVSEETLAISVYCTMKYIDDFSKAITVSVNHNGDSDSTGAVTGNLIGTIVGYKNIPKKWKLNLELFDILLEIADDLYSAYQKDYDTTVSTEWKEKYIEYTFRNNISQIR